MAVKDEWVGVHIYVQETRWRGGIKAVEGWNRMNTEVERVRPESFGGGGGKE